jgi:hypothetical protein
MILFCFFCFTDYDAQFAASLRAPQRSQPKQQPKQKRAPIDAELRAQLDALQTQQMGMLQALDQFSRKVSTVLQTLNDRYFSCMWCRVVVAGVDLCCVSLLLLEQHTGLAPDPTAIPEEKPRTPEPVDPSGGCYYCCCSLHFLY